MPSAFVDTRARRFDLEPSKGSLEIVFPEDGKLRSRKVVSRSRARPTGKYPSWKMGRMLQWESHNELNAFRLLDANPSVREFHEQPAEIHYSLHGEKHRHYPDILVVYSSAKKEFWEIKPKKEASAPETVQRTELLSAQLPIKGFGYRMVLGEDISKQPRLANILDILHYGRRPVNDIERERLRLIFNQGSIAWGAIKGGLLGSAGRKNVSRLVLEGVLRLNLEHELTESTPLSWVEEC
jgi:hypothetical protein